MVKFSFERNKFDDRWISSFSLDNPSARVQFLLGDEDQEEDDEEHKPHDLFIELDELVTDGEKGNEQGETVEQGWKETAR